MIFIKHRANDLSLKYDGPIEIDVWVFDGKFFIGHDEEELYEMPEGYYNQKWVHCKNVEAYKTIRLRDENTKCFMHGSIISGDCNISEPIAVVQGGYYWTTVPANVCGLTVFMDVQGTKYTIEEIAMIHHGHGVCSDHPEKWKELFA